MINMTVAVACLNAAGCSDFFVTQVNVSQEQYEEGIHYDVAKEKAEENGYEGPFVCYDNYEIVNILRVMPDLENAPTLE